MLTTYSHQWGWWSTTISMASVYSNRWPSNYTKQNNITSYSKGWKCTCSTSQARSRWSCKSNWQVPSHWSAQAWWRAGTQSTIVRFKSHSFREKAYIDRKKCNNRSIKIKLSLTRKRTKTVTYAYQISNKLPNVNFFYADIHSNLKLQLNEPINNKIVYPFRDKQELLNLFIKFKWNIDGLELEEEVNGGMY